MGIHYVDVYRTYVRTYKDNLDNCTEIEGDAFDRYDYKFHSIEENKCQIIESLKETL